MSRYGKIDPIIQKWVNNHDLHLNTNDRDWEVRSVHFLGGKKRSIEYQIWIDEPDESGKVKVNISAKNPPHSQRTLEANLETLEQVLETAWRLATS